MVSYYLPVHFMALNAILKKIIVGGGGGGVGWGGVGWGVDLNLRLSDWKLSENHS